MARTRKRNDEEVLLLYLLARRRRRRHDKRRKPRRIWVHEILQKREELGEFHKLIRELWSHDDRFFAYFRMTQRQYTALLRYVRTDITKKTTNWRRPICASERLAVCLRSVLF